MVLPIAPGVYLAVKRQRRNPTGASSPTTSAMSRRGQEHRRHFFINGAECKGLKLPFSKGCSFYRCKPGRSGIKCLRLCMALSFVPCPTINLDEVCLVNFCWEQQYQQKR
ncbi:uncharacterized protein [Triticum aestivum]|uniref:uncharacterized protein n=1 Tax=Triticum aestivum TaxID=4565 RepID=UPI001D024BC7|nr:uncharacterized protein LOC123126278 [Triticum aestivum]